MTTPPQYGLQVGGSGLTKDQRRALTTRADLLAAECEVVTERRITWRGRLAELGNYGTSGGSAGDRRRIVEAMAALEIGGSG